MPNGSVSENDAVREEGAGERAIAAMLDAIEWVGLDEPDQLHRDDVFATHEGVLDLPGFGRIRVYQLNTGARVFNADDVFPGLTSESDPSDA